MADVTAQQPLLDVRIGDASWLNKVYLNQGKKILGLLSVGVFLDRCFSKDEGGR